jgi:hypothetical protein
MASPNCSDGVNAEAFIPMAETSEKTLKNMIIFLIMISSSLFHIPQSINNFSVTPSSVTKVLRSIPRTAFEAEDRHIKHCPRVALPPHVLFPFFHRDIGIRIFTTSFASIAAEMISEPSTSCNAPTSRSDYVSCKSL